MTVKEQRNIVIIGIDDVTKIANVFETARPKRLGVEAYSMEKASSYGLPVPAVREYGIDQGGKEYLVMEKIEGKSVADPSLTTPLESVYRRLGEVIRRTPQEYRTFGWIVPGTFQGISNSWNEFMSKHIETYASGLQRRGKLDNSEVRQIVETVSRQVPDITRAGLIHRDLKPLNLMLEHKSNRLVILDWECAMIGDPLYDIGVLQSRYCEDDRLYKGLLHGMTGGIPDSDQCRRTSVYGLVNLIDTLFAYKERTTRSHWQKLSDLVHTLNSSSPDFYPMQTRKIKIPKPIPSYTGD